MDDGYPKSCSDITSHNFKPLYHKYIIDVLVNMNKYIAAPVGGVRMLFVLVINQVYNLKILVCHQGVDTILNY